MTNITTDFNMEASENQFYSSYSWCINPILTLQYLFKRLQEEMDRYGHQQISWQQEECKINMYLFV